MAAAIPDETAMEKAGFVLREDICKKYGRKEAEKTSESAEQLAEAAGLDKDGTRACTDFMMHVGDMTGKVPTTPKTFQEAMDSPHGKMWWDAHQAELQQMADKGVFTLIKKTDVPKGATIMKCKTVFKVK